MTNLGEKIKNIRIANNLKQSELAKMLFVSEKTISSWENNRTVPDLNMIYKISDYFKKSFYCLINDELDTENTNEIEIKLKVNEEEYSRILNIILNTLGSKQIGTINKNRTIYIYKDKYEFSFDIVKDIGIFIEIELINKSNDFEKDFFDLLNLLEDLKIDLNIVDRKKYIDYLEEK